MLQCQAYIKFTSSIFWPEMPVTKYQPRDIPEEQCHYLWTLSSSNTNKTQPSVNRNMTVGYRKIDDSQTMSFYDWSLLNFDTVSSCKWIAKFRRGSYVFTIWRYSEWADLALQFCIHMCPLPANCHGMPTRKSGTKSKVSALYKGVYRPWDFRFECQRCCKHNAKTYAGEKCWNYLNSL